MKTSRVSGVTITHRKKYGEKKPTVEFYLTRDEYTLLDLLLLCYDIREVKERSERVEVIRV